MSGMRLVIQLLLWVVICGWTIGSDASGDNGVSSENHVETFEDIEKRLKVTVQSAVKMLLPHLLKESANANISGPCTASLMKTIGGIRQLKEWALRFIDATGKIPPGILEGTSLSLGDYEECLDIEVGKRDDPPRTPDEVVFRGQYCLIEIHKPKAIDKAMQDFQNGNEEDNPISKSKTFLNMLVRYKHLSTSTIKLGVCIPSKCTKDDAMSMMNSETIRKYIGTVTIPSCKLKGDDTTSLSQTILLSIFGVYFMGVLLCTCADIFYRITAVEEKVKPEASSALSLFKSVVKRTSLYANAIDIMNTSKRSEQLECLCGLRTIIVLLIIYSHSYAHLHILNFQKYTKAANFLKFFDNFTFSGVGNGSVTADSIICIAGITITYGIWRNVSDKGTVNLNVCKLLILRYCRWTGAQLLVISIFLMTPLFGSGPIWSIYMTPMLENCQQRWWVNILYLTNFWETKDTCLYHTWMFAIIMQLTLLGVVIVFILKRSFVFGVLFMVMLTLMGIIGVAAMTIIHHLPGGLAFSMLTIRTFPIIWRDVYILPYDHVGSFCIGLLAGYLLAVKKDRLEMSKLKSALVWCAAISCNAAVMFGLYRYRHGVQMDISLSTFYAALHRNVWSLGIGWLVVACTTHHGGPLSRVLKSKVFIPLDRLCYMAYLLHMPIQFYHSGVMRERWYMGHGEIMFTAISYMVMSFAMSFFLNIAFASPYFALEEHVCSYFKCKHKVTFDSKTTLQESSIPNYVSGEADNPVDSNGCINLAYSKKLDEL